MDYKGLCEQLVGETFRHRITGQIREVMLSQNPEKVLFNQARWYGWGPFASSSFLRTYKSAYHWLRNADMIAERGQAYRDF